MRKCRRVSPAASVSGFLRVVSGFTPKHALEPANEHIQRLVSLGALNFDIVLYRHRIEIERNRRIEGEPRIASINRFNLFLFPAICHNSLTSTPGEYRVFGHGVIPLVQATTIQIAVLAELSPLDRSLNDIAPLSPGAVIVPDVWVAEQFRQHEPGVRGTLADPAVDDDIAIRLDALALI